LGTGARREYDRPPIAEARRRALEDIDDFIERQQLDILRQASAQHNIEASGSMDG